MPLTDALATVMESRVPADEYVDPVEGAPKIFVARRWYSE